MIRSPERSPRSDPSDYYIKIFNSIKKDFFRDKLPKTLNSKDTMKLIELYETSYKKNKTLQGEKQEESRETRDIRHRIIWGNYSKIFEKAQEISMRKKLKNEQCVEVLHELILYSLTPPCEQKPSLLKSYNENIRTNRPFSTHLGIALDRYSKILFSTSAEKNSKLFLWEKPSTRSLAKGDNNAPPHLRYSTTDLEKDLYMKELQNELKEWLAKHKNTRATNFISSHYLEGLTFSQIARSNNINPRTVANTIRNFMNTQMKKYQFAIKFKDLYPIPRIFLEDPFAFYVKK